MPINRVVGEGSATALLSIEMSPIMILITECCKQLVGSVVGRLICICFIAAGGRFSGVFTRNYCMQLLNDKKAQSLNLSADTRMGSSRVVDGLFVYSSI